MRRTADLHLRPAAIDGDRLERMASLAVEMGLSCLGIALDLTVSNEKKKDVLRIFVDHGIDTLSRTDLTHWRRQELLRVLPKARANFDLVAVECSSRQVSSLAFRDRRVDMIYFNPERPRYRFSDLFSKNANRPVEVNLSDVLAFQPLSLRVARIMAQIAEARKNHAPILVSSGARDFLSMRGPQEMAALAKIAGLDLPEALKAVSDVPIDLAENRLRRRASGYITEGVRMVER